MGSSKCCWRRATQSRPIPISSSRRRALRVQCALPCSEWCNHDISIAAEFQGGRALVVIGRGGREGALESTLAKLGVTTEYPDIVGGRAQIDVGGLQPERDILFVDGDLEGAVAIEVNPASRLPPVPVIGLVGVEAPSRLKALVNLGATSFLRKPVHGGAVYTSLFMGINQFLLRSDMYARLQDLELRRRGRRAVIRAVVLLMQQNGLDEEGAYSQLRRE